MKVSSQSRKFLYNRLRESRLLAPSDRQCSASFTQPIREKYALQSTTSIHLPGLQPVFQVGLPLAEQPEPLRGRPDVRRADALPQLVLQRGDLVEPRDYHRLEVTSRGLQK